MIPLSLSFFSWVGPMSILFRFPVFPRCPSKMLTARVILQLPSGWNSRAAHPVLRYFEKAAWNAKNPQNPCLPHWDRHPGLRGHPICCLAGAYLSPFLVGKPGRIWSPRERTWLWNTRETKMDKIRTVLYLCRSLPFSALRMEFSSWAHKHQMHFFWHRIGRIGTWSKSWWQGLVRSVRSVRAHFLPQRSKERSCNTQALQRYQ